MRPPEAQRLVGGLEQLHGITFVDGLIGSHG